MPWLVVKHDGRRVLDGLRKRFLEESESGKDGGGLGGWVGRILGGVLAAVVVFNPLK